MPGTIQTLTLEVFPILPATTARLTITKGGNQANRITLPDPATVTILPGASFATFDIALAANATPDDTGTVSISDAVFIHTDGMNVTRTANPLVIGGELFGLDIDGAADTATIRVGAQPAGTVNICARTPQVEAAILAHSGVSETDCAIVPQTQLNSINSLNLLKQLPSTITTTLRGDDFANLGNLDDLSLGINGLETLPANVFDGLSSLTHLNLGTNDLESLPAGLFDDLSSLVHLFLDTNSRLTRLPAGLFDAALGTLTTLKIDDTLKSMAAMNPLGATIARGRTQTLTATLDPPSPVTVRLRTFTAGNQAGNVERPATVTIPAGMPSVTFDIALAETATPGDTGRVSLSNPMLIYTANGMTQQNTHNINNLLKPRNTADLTLHFTVYSSPTATFKVFTAQSGGTEVMPDNNGQIPIAEGSSLFVRFMLNRPLIAGETLTQNYSVVPDGAMPADLRLGGMGNDSNFVPFVVVGPAQTEIHEVMAIHDDTSEAPERFRVKISLTLEINGASGSIHTTPPGRLAQETSLNFEIQDVAPAPSVTYTLDDPEAVEPANNTADANPGLFTLTLRNLNTAQMGGSGERRFFFRFFPSGVSGTPGYGSLHSDLAGAALASPDDFSLSVEYMQPGQNTLTTRTVSNSGSIYETDNIPRAGGDTEGEEVYTFRVVPNLNDDSDPVEHIVFGYRVFFSGAVPDQDLNQVNRLTGTVDGSPARPAMTITDAPSATLTRDRNSIEEGVSTPGVFTLVLDNVPDGPAVVTYTLAVSGNNPDSGDISAAFGGAAAGTPTIGSNAAFTITTSDGGNTATLTITPETDGDMDNETVTLTIASIEIAGLSFGPTDLMCNDCSPPGALEITVIDAEAPVPTATYALTTPHAFEPTSNGAGDEVAAVFTLTLSNLNQVQSNANMRQFFFSLIMGDSDSAPGYGDRDPSIASLMIARYNTTLNDYRFMLEYTDSNGENAQVAELGLFGSIQRTDEIPRAQPEPSGEEVYTFRVIPQHDPTAGDDNDGVEGVESLPFGYRVVFVGADSENEFTGRVNGGEGDPVPTISDPLVARLTRSNSPTEESNSPTPAVFTLTLENTPSGPAVVTYTLEVSGDTPANDDISAAFGSNITETTPVIGGGGSDTFTINVNISNSGDDTAATLDITPETDNDMDNETVTLTIASIEVAGLSLGPDDLECGNCNPAGGLEITVIDADAPDPAVTYALTTPHAFEPTSNGAGDEVAAVFTLTLSNLNQAQRDAAMRRFIFGLIGGTSNTPGFPGSTPGYNPLDPSIASLEIARYNTSLNDYRLMLEYTDMNGANAQVAALMLFGSIQHTDEIPRARPEPSGEEVYTFRVIPQHDPTAGDDNDGVEGVESLPFGYRVVFPGTDSDADLKGVVNGGEGDPVPTISDPLVARLTRSNTPTEEGDSPMPAVFTLTLENTPSGPAVVTYTLEVSGTTPANDDISAAFSNNITGTPVVGGDGSDTFTINVNISNSGDDTAATLAITPVSDVDVTDETVTLTITGIEVAGLSLGPADLTCSNCNPTGALDITVTDDLILTPSVTYTLDNRYTFEPAASGRTAHSGTFTLRLKNLNEAQSNTNMRRFFFNLSESSSGNAPNITPGTGTLHDSIAGITRANANDFDLRIEYMQPDATPAMSDLVPGFNTPANIPKAGGETGADEVYTFRVVPEHDNNNEGMETVVFGYRIFFSGISGGNQGSGEVNRLDGTVNGDPATMPAMIITEAPTVTFTRGAPSVTEGSNGSYTLSLGPELNAVVTVTYTLELTGRNATPNDIFTVFGGNVTTLGSPVADGTSSTFTIPAVINVTTPGFINILTEHDDDRTDEDVTLTIHQVEILGITLGPDDLVCPEECPGGALTITIDDDDAADYDSTDDIELTEGSGIGAIRTIMFTNTSSADATATFTLAGGTTTGAANPDLIITVGGGANTLSFNADGTGGTFIIPAADDEVTIIFIPADDDGDAFAETITFEITGIDFADAENDIGPLGELIINITDSTNICGRTEEVHLAIRNAINSGSPPGCVVTQDQLNLVTELDLNSASLQTGDFAHLNNLERLLLNNNALTTLPDGLLDDILDTLTELQLNAGLRRTLGLSVNPNILVQGGAVIFQLNAGTALEAGLGARVPWTAEFGGGGTADHFIGLSDSGTVNIAPGMSSATFEVTASGDAPIGANATVTLGAPSLLYDGDNDGSSDQAKDPDTALSNDPVPSLVRVDTGNNEQTITIVLDTRAEYNSEDAITITEGGTTAVRTLTLSNAPNDDAIVRFTLAGGVADATAVTDPDIIITVGGGADTLSFNADGTGGTFRIPAGDLSVTIIFAAVADNDDAVEIITFSITEIDFANTVTDISPLPGLVINVNNSICDRTQEVIDAIGRAINSGSPPACGDIAETQLRNITGLLMDNRGVTSLKTGDFAGLAGLLTLNLQGNSLESLPPGVFDSLTDLRTLNLRNNSLESLRLGVFDSLTSLTTLNLRDNSLESLRPGVFDSLPDLHTLDLRGNSLESLASGVFDSLTGLRTLDLTGNNLAALNSNLFQELAQIRTLRLAENSLTTLPEDIFASLTTLGTLTLGQDSDAPQTFSLPADLFNGLSNLASLVIKDNGERLTSLHPDLFEGLDNLGVLGINGNTRLTSLDPDLLDGLDSLRTLRMNNNTGLTSLPAGFFDDVLDTLSQLSRPPNLPIRMLSLSGVSNNLPQGRTTSLQFNLNAPIEAGLGVRMSYTVTFGEGDTADHFGGLSSGTVDIGPGMESATIEVNAPLNATPGATATIALTPTPARTAPFNEPRGLFVLYNGDQNDEIATHSNTLVRDLAVVDNNNHEQTLTIIEPPPNPTRITNIAVENASVSESDDVIVTVTLDQPMPEGGNILYTISAPTGSSAGIQNHDVDSLLNGFSFAIVSANTQSIRFTAVVQDDHRVETDVEEGRITINTIGWAQTGFATTVNNVVDFSIMDNDVINLTLGIEDNNDIPVTLSSAGEYQVRVRESIGMLNVSIHAEPAPNPFDNRGVVLDRSITADLTSSNGTAFVGTDFTFLGLTAMYSEDNAAHTTFAPVPATIAIHDNDNGEARVFTLALSSDDRAANLDTPPHRARVTIVPDTEAHYDNTDSLILVEDGAASAERTLTLLHAPSTDATVHFALSGGTALRLDVTNPDIILSIGGDGGVLAIDPNGMGGNFRIHAGGGDAATLVFADNPDVPSVGTNIGFTITGITFDDPGTITDIGALGGFNIAITNSAAATAGVGETVGTVREAAPANTAEVTLQIRGLPGGHGDGTLQLSVPQRAAGNLNLPAADTDYQFRYQVGGLTQALVPAADFPDLEITIPSEQISTGEVDIVITLNAVDDNDNYDEDEAIAINFDTVTFPGASVAGLPVTVSVPIADDDDVSATLNKEGSPAEHTISPVPGDFILTLDQAPDATARVTYTLGGGLGTKYTAALAGAGVGDSLSDTVNSVFTIPKDNITGEGTGNEGDAAGAAEVTITINPQNDADFDNEDVTLTIHSITFDNGSNHGNLTGGNLTGINISNGAQTLTIMEPPAANYDNTAVITITEGGNAAASAERTLTLANVPNNDATVMFTFAGGTANGTDVTEPDIDFSIISGGENLAINAAGTSGTFTIPVNTAAAVLAFTARDSADSTGERITFTVTGIVFDDGTDDTNIPGLPELTINITDPTPGRLEVSVRNTDIEVSDVTTITFALTNIPTRVSGVEVDRIEFKFRGFPLQAEFTSSTGNPAPLTFGDNGAGYDLTISENIMSSWRIRDVLSPPIGELTVNVSPSALTGEAADITLRVTANAVSSLTATNGRVRVYGDINQDGNRNNNLGHLITATGSFGFTIRDISPVNANISIDHDDGDEDDEDTTAIAESENIVVTVILDQPLPENGTIHYMILPRAGSTSRIEAHDVTGGFDAASTAPANQGENTIEFTVNVADDNRIDAAEQEEGTIEIVRVEWGSDGGLLAIDTPVNFTITDNDGVRMSLSDTAPRVRDNAGSLDISLNIVPLPSPATNPPGVIVERGISANIATGDDSATDANPNPDYTALSNGDYSRAAGTGEVETSFDAVTYPITITQDGDTDDETFTVTLSSDDNAVDIATPEATVTIVPNTTGHYGSDGDTFTLNENGNTLVERTLTLGDPPSNSNATVLFGLTGGTAATRNIADRHALMFTVDGGATGLMIDDDNMGGRFTIPANDRAVTLNFRASNDFYGDDETITFSITRITFADDGIVTDVTDGIPGSLPPNLTINITDTGPAAEVTADGDDTAISELVLDDSAVIRVTLTNIPSAATNAVIGFGLTGATLDADYTVTLAGSSAAANSVTITKADIDGSEAGVPQGGAPGSAEATLTFLALNDLETETETIELTINDVMFAGVSGLDLAPGAGITNNSQSIAIADRPTDAVAIITVGEASVTEGGGLSTMPNFRITFLNIDSDSRAGTVNYAFSAGFSAAASTNPAACAIGAGTYCAFSKIASDPRVGLTNQSGNFTFTVSSVSTTDSEIGIFILPREDDDAEDETVELTITSILVPQSGGDITFSLGNNNLVDSNNMPATTAARITIKDDAIRLRIRTFLEGALQ